MRNDMEEKMNMITCNDEEKMITIPYIVYETAETRHERREKRLLWVIAGVVVLLFLSNMAWLWVFQSYDYVSEEVVIDNNDGGNANYVGNDGDINNGEDTSKKDETN